MSTTFSSVPARSTIGWIVALVVLILVIVAAIFPFHRVDPFHFT